jgi:endonuclease III
MTPAPTRRQATTVRSKRRTPAQPAAQSTATPTAKPAAKRAPRIVLRTRFPQRKGTALKTHAAAVFGELVRLYPNAHCELDHRNAYELTVATILSAQCTDKRVNMVTPAVFATYANATALALAEPDDVETLVKSTGFFRAKTRSLLGMASRVVTQHGGEIPCTMAELVVLPGVGRKTANVVLGNAFGINVGVVVDTHVGRLANRLGLTRATDPVKVEQALMPLFPARDWTMLSHLLIWHGRQVCDARVPRCGACTLRPLCPSAPLEQ